MSSQACFLSHIYMVSEENCLSFSSSVKNKFFSLLLLSIYLLCICSGYLAPEYALSRQLRKNADVYSFGVLVLVVVSGRSSSKAEFGEESLVLVEWVSFCTQFIKILV